MSLPEGGWPKTATAMYFGYVVLGYLFWPADPPGGQKRPAEEP